MNPSAGRLVAQAYTSAARALEMHGEVAAEERILEWIKNAVQLTISQESLYHVLTDVQVRARVERDIARVVVSLSQGLLTDRLFEGHTEVPFRTVVEVPYVHRAEVAVGWPWYRRWFGLEPLRVSYTGRGTTRVQVSGTVRLDYEHLAGYPEQTMVPPHPGLGAPVRISMLREPITWQPDTVVVPLTDDDMGSSPQVGHVSFPDE